MTLGIYSYVYNYQVHDEMKRHTGRGLGGGIALLLSLLAGVAMPFLTPNEVGALYTRRGDKPPVRANDLSTGQGVGLALNRYWQSLQRCMPFRSRTVTRGRFTACSRDLTVKGCVCIGWPSTASPWWV